jgi:hypothetical protein
MIKKAWAVWKGGIEDGGGAISTGTGCPVSKLLKAQITMDAKLEA